MTRVSAGDPLRISADRHNRVSDAVEDVEARKRSEVSNPTRMGGDRDIVLVRNDSGAAINRFAVLGLDGPIIEPTANEASWKNGVAFKGISPTIADHWQTFVIALTPLGEEKTGPAVVSGVVNLKLSVTDDADEVAGIDDGENTHLITGAGPALILWKDVVANEDVDGRRWGTILMGAGMSGHHHSGTLDGNLDTGGTANVTTDAGLTLEDVNAPAWMTAGKRVETGEPVGVSLFSDGLYYVTWAPCPIDQP